MLSCLTLLPDNFCDKFEQIGRFLVLRSDMKYSSTENADPPGVETKPSGLKRLKNVLGRFKSDLRKPLPEAKGKNLIKRIVFRFRYLFRRYGWKMLLAVIAYYLIRDTLLYIILPYLIARQFIN
jgi:hypothetical protein